MSPPKLINGARVCVVLSERETKFYGNSEGLRVLGDWMHWLASAPEEEHYEFHLRWHLEAYESRETGEPHQVWVLSELDPAREGQGARNERGYHQTEFSFMIVQDSDLDALAAAVRQQAAERCGKEHDE
jgi:hypothetical protein